MTRAIQGGRGSRLACEELGNREVLLGPLSQKKFAFTILFQAERGDTHRVQSVPSPFGLSIAYPHRKDCVLGCAFNRVFQAN